MEKLNRREFMGVLAGAVAATSVESKSGIEAAPEFPSRESIHQTFEALLQGVQGQVSENFEDEDGVVARLITFELQNETVELEYIRQGRHEAIKRGSIETTMYVTFFEDGIPAGGTRVAEFKNGEWTLVNTEVLESQ